MRYRLLGTSGLRVSELCLGTMTFGEDWGWGAPEEESRAMFELFAESGGNFIDTANNYTHGTSERIVGDCIRSNRDRFVVATKYTLRLRPDDPRDANLGGNSRKSMVRSIEGSLRRLGTDYVDLLYLHMWDFTTSVEEVLQSASHLIASGKVLYFAFSDTPSWVVSSAIATARGYGWPGPVAIQVPYSLFDRSVERDVLPMARAYDLAILAWGVLESGVLTGKYGSEPAGPRRQASATEEERAAGAAVVRMGNELGWSPAQVAINWVRQQRGNLVPILGCRTARQLQDNLGCLDFLLTAEQIAALGAVTDFRMGFPNGFLLSDHVRQLIFGDTFALLDCERIPNP